MTGVELQILWATVAAFLAMQMHAGFMLTAIGFTRAANALSAFMKAYVVFSIIAILYTAIGASVQFGAGTSGLLPLHLWSPLSNGADMLPFLHVVIGATVVGCIVLGGVVGRTRFAPYLVVAVAVALVVFPFFGRWAIGGRMGDAGPGWLERLGFLDVAGAAWIHVLGGVLALAGAWVAGPRMGKFTSEGAPRAIPGSQMTLAALGVYLLSLGWCAFQVGCYPLGFDMVHALWSGLAASSAGVISAMTMSWLLTKKPDASFTLNGALIGLAAISVAPASWTPLAAVFLGLVGGALVIPSALFIERVLKVDDPVGVISVHAGGGLLGLLAAGLLLPGKGLLAGGTASFLAVQLLGGLVAVVWAGLAGLGLFIALRKWAGLRARPIDEIKGLDLTEHGTEAYHGFQIFDNL